MLDASTRAASALKNATIELKDDRELALQAIKNNPGCVYTCNIKFRTDIKFILEACKTNNMAVYYLPKKYLLNDDVKKIAYSIKFFDEEWENYPDEWFDIDELLEDEGDFY